MPKHTKVALSNVKTLTLRKGAKTTAKRSKAYPQLTCQGKYCAHAPSTVQCKQVGHDGVSPQWKCEAELPSSLAFGPLEVVCEGWSRAGDTNVLAGSCALEYELVRSNLDAESQAFSVPMALRSKDTWDRAASWLFMVATIYAVWRIFKSVTRPSAQGRAVGSNRPSGGGAGGGGGGGGPGGGGGGGGGPWWNPRGDAPPPPYKQYPDPPTSSTGGFNSGGMGSGAGFWTGLAAGAAGSALYNRATRPAQPQPQPQPFGFGQNAQAGPSRWFGRGTGANVGGYGDSDFDISRVPRGARQESSSDIGGGEMRNATGFGGSRTR